MEKNNSVVEESSEPHGHEAKLKDPDEDHFDRVWTLDKRKGYFLICFLRGDLAADKKLLMSIGGLMFVFPT